MNLTRNKSRMLFAERLALLALTMMALTMPAQAAARRRVVGPVPDVTVTGTVTDTATGAPVVNADVVNGNKLVHTLSDGQYQTTVPGGRPTTITVSRSGYTPTSQTITPSANTTLNFKVTSTATISVKLTTGETKLIDPDTAVFAYYIPFGSPARSNAANFCRPDGSSWQPDRSLFAHIYGPATSATSAACCKFPIMTANVELKTGEKSQVFFTDSCLGSEVDFGGLDHNSGAFLYINFATIAQIDFP